MLQSNSAQSSSSSVHRMWTTSSAHSLTNASHPRKERERDVQFISLEPLSTEAGPIDFEQTLYQALVNEGKHVRVLNAKRPQFSYNEKQLRDAAAAEVAQHNSFCSDDSDKGSKKRKQLSADDKAKQNRDRNREHARNTRLRKKAYVTKLKDLVDQLTQQKDLEERERRILGERIHDTHVIRKNSVRLMLSYRAANIQDREKWAAILDESFIFTLPISPYRSFQKSDIVNSSRVLVGIDAAISDTASLALLAESIGQGTDKWKGAMQKGQGCRVVYSCTKNDMLAAGDLIMCRYMMRIDGCEQVGAHSGCVQHGMLQCKFNKQNKMISAEMMYDVMGFMQQLQKASCLCPENSIVPNTLGLALQPNREARAIIKAEPPYLVMHVNDAWTQLKKSSQSQVESMRFDTILQVLDSGIDMLHALLVDASFGRAGSIIVATQSSVHHEGSLTEAQDIILNYVKILPLSDDSDSVSHFMAVAVEIGRLVPTKSISDDLSQSSANDHSSPMLSSSVVGAQNDNNQSNPIGFYQANEVSDPSQSAAEKVEESQEQYIFFDGDLRHSSERNISEDNLVSLGGNNDASNSENNNYEKLFCSENNDLDNAADLDIRDEDGTF